MRRILDLFHEWFDIRTRVKEEFRFHLQQTEADWLAVGVSRREAHRTARRRLGARQTRRKALNELGGDLPGLVNLFHAHQLSASAWIRPLGVVTAAALFLAISPDSHAILQGIDGRTQTMRSIPEMVIAKVIWACIAFVMPWYLIWALSFGAIVVCVWIYLAVATGKAVLTRTSPVSRRVISVFFTATFALYLPFILYWRLTILPVLGINIL
ncbi:MAG: permease prefix domain 1-containing protein [Bryobacteraceae bacterium]